MSLRNLLPNGKPSTPNGEAPKKKESMNFIDNLDTYGTYKFKGKVAAPYLKAQGLPVDTLENPTWTHTLADKVAKAVVEWCKDKGATMATHWFQPLGSAGVRRGRMSNTGASAAPPAARLWLGQRQVQSMPASRLGRPRAAGRRVLVGRPTRYEALRCPEPSRRVRASAELVAETGAGRPGRCTTRCSTSARTASSSGTSTAATCSRARLTAPRT